MKIYKIVFVMFAQIAFFAQGMEGGKRGRNDEEKEQEYEKGERQPPRKKPRPLSHEEKRQATQRLHQAITERNIDMAQRALDEGANIEEFIDGETALAHAMEPFFRSQLSDNRIPLLLVNLLVNRGAIISPETMAEGAFTPVNLIVNFIQHGGNFANSQDAMVEHAIGLIDDAWWPENTVNPAYIEPYITNQKRASEVVLWLLLRGNLNQVNSDALKNGLKSASTETAYFLTPDLKTILLRERLGPILLALIFNNQDEAKNLIRGLPSAFYPTDQEENWINEALIFAAAHGNIEILDLILQKFKMVLTQYNLGQALEAAALRGQLDTFKTLVESGFFADTELIKALRSSLMIAAAQIHENIVEFILALDWSQRLNLNILPIGERIRTLARNPALSEEIRTSYTNLEHMLFDHLYRRNSRRIVEQLPDRPVQEIPLASAEEHEIAVIPQLPPELILLILNFMRPPHKTL